MRGLALCTAAVNVAAMILASVAGDWGVFAVAWAGAVFALWGWLYLGEDPHPMGYRNLAMQLRWEISNGDHPLEPGTRLPSTQQYAQRFATTRTTVTRALRLLAEEGLVEIVRGRGAYVCGPRTDRPKDRVEQVLLDIINTHPAGTPLPETKWVALNMNTSEMTVRRVEQTLAEQGLIVRTRNGRYVKA